jgi:hypothetical protein
MAVGTEALRDNNANFNLAIGYRVGFKNTTGRHLTGIGATALLNNTIGSFNTAIGAAALQDNTTGENNTAIGSAALAKNTMGEENTAIGRDALFENTTGKFNTATGHGALTNNIGADGNTANGFFALHDNTAGEGNTAIGQQALAVNQATFNTATGFQALFSNDSGGGNTASGVNALLSNTGGDFNTAIGFNALNINTAGNNNIALGFSAGSIITGDNNIDIGSTGGGSESGTIRIGQSGSQTRTFIAGINVTPLAGSAVLVDAFGQLGVQVSSQRFKDEIKSMDKESESVLALKPVRFRYKKELDPDRHPQFGLLAEDVEKVNPDLIVRDNEGKPYTVRYDAVNAMLLNEFLKEHRKVEEQAETIAKLTSTVAQQRRDFQATIAKLEDSVTARLKEQAAQIQKVNAQLAAASPSSGGLEASKAAPQVVNNP